MTFWIHEISQSALAAAVAALGLVILLELRSIVRLRRLVDAQLNRLFEQLDLLRFESQQMLEAQARTATAQGPLPGSLAAQPPPNALAPYQPPAFGAEARLIAALTAARARLGRNQSERGA